MASEIHFNKSLSIWFAPRRWPWWAWGVVALTIPVIYFMSVPIVDCAAWSVYDRYPWIFDTVVNTCSIPAYWCSDNCRVLESFLQWEYKTVNDLFFPHAMPEATGIFD